MPQYSTTVRNARLDQLETTVGTAPKLQIWSGALPANCAAADAGVKLWEEDLPADWAAAAAAGAKALAGVWQALALATGTPVHYRLKDTAGTTCHMQGTCAVGSGELNLDGTITINQQITVNSFTITEGNP